MLSITILDLIDEALTARDSAIRVSLPGKVIKYYVATNTADVAVSVKKRLAPIEDEDLEESWESYPTLRNVPIKFPRSRDFAITFPLTAGDRVDVHFADVNLSTWRAGGEEERDPQAHGLGGAYCTPGLYPDSEAWEASETHAVLEHRTGGRVAVGPSGVELGRGAGLAPLPVLSSVQAAIATVLAYAGSIPGAPPPPPPPTVAGTTQVTAK